MVQSAQSMVRSSVLLRLRQYLRQYRIRRRRRQLESEKSIGEYLDWLRIKGYRIYNDIPGDSGNFDHVVVCTQGIYLINIKLRRLPSDGDCVVEFDGAGVSINDGPPDRSPVNEVLGQVEQLERILKERTERSFSVRPVLLFPGWHIKDSEVPKTSGVWVLNPRSLGKWIDFRPASLHAERVREIVEGLDNYLRQFA